MTGHGFAFRTPWYVREREHIGLRDARALRPAIQMYDSTRFVQQVTQDPRDSLRFTDHDRWSYPVPVAFPAGGTGRIRFATYTTVRTGLRKLFQPNHERFYLVVAELFCDEPGLPRAGPHRDVAVSFVMRRRHLSLSGGQRSVRRLARELMVNLLKEQHAGAPLAARPAVQVTDLDDLWWADVAARRRFTEDHADLLHAVTAHVDSQSWLIDSSTGNGRWALLSDQKKGETEQAFPMWRLPDRTDTCDAANTRSLWFGLVPTYSGDHWVDPAQPHHRPEPKLDDHAIYELVCSVQQPPPAGQEQCPPKVWWSAPTEPFRLAAPYDPDGTQNHRVSITAPDFRALAARAGHAPGPGGLAITTPSRSGMKFNPFNGIPGPGSGSLGSGGICTFAFELFFIVALFLFLMFMPIVVWVFQLWWMLALRFCFPKLTMQFQALATFFNSFHANILGDLAADVSASAAFDAIMGVTVPPGTGEPGVAASMIAARTNFPGPFNFTGALTQDLITAVDPAKVPPSASPPIEAKPDDPLCPAP